MSFTSIIWDLDEDPNGNVQHCAEHEVTKEEVEEVLSIPTGRGTSRGSGRPACYGHTSAGRFLIVIYDEIDEDTVRPVTAYDVTPRMR